MSLLEHPFKKIRQEFYEDWTQASLKAAIVLWALFIIFLVIFVVDNKWILAGILAYEILP